MQYDFLNDIYKEASEFIGANTFSENNTSELNKFILNTNKEVLDDFVEFFKEDKKVFLLKGFMGSGKTVILNSLADFLSKEVLFFKINFFPATNLDDILLSLFKDFASFHNEKKLVLPKVDSNIFSEKINTFIKSIDKPMVFAFDSLELNKVEKNIRKDILYFLDYLTRFEKIKVVISSRSFDEDDLPSIGIVAIAKLLDLQKFSELISIGKIEENAFHIEQMFKHTKGHLLYSSMVINIIKLLQISFPSLEAEYSKRNTTFPEFLIFKILGLLPDKFLKLLWFLASIRQGVSESFIIKQSLASKEDIEHLKSRMVIAADSNFIYLKDYIKEELLKTMEPESQAKVHNYLKELYESQLPKKPSLRDLLISRATMRKEIDYHSSQFQLAKTGNLSQAQHGEKVGFNYLSYSRSVSYDWNFQSSPIAFTNLPETPSLSSRKQGSYKSNFELTEEEIKLVNETMDNDKMDMSGSSNVDSGGKIAIIEEATSEQQSYGSGIEGRLNLAQRYESAYDFSSAINTYKAALELKEDSLFELKKPIIMTKLALCYKKNQKLDTAILQFQKVYELYLSNEPIKANYILLNIAQIYVETYKFTQAKDTYNKILTSSVNNPSSLLGRVYLDLAEIEDNNSNPLGALNNCQKALTEIETIDDLGLKSEAFFKYALYLDDFGKLDEAFSFYNKCAEVSEDPTVNTYLSSAYSNIAGIYSERNDYNNAIEYYELAINVDKKQNNFEGLYFGYSKIAHILQVSYPDRALENLVKALGAARRLEDHFYAASAYLELGDFYYNRKMDAKALKSYFQARRLIMKQPNEENVQKVNTRINDLKVRLGNAKFMQLIGEFKKK